MRIAFYAPMKPPNHPWPSGDRLMARLFPIALEKAGFTVEHASTFRSFDGLGDPGRQRRIGAVGKQLAKRLTHRFHNRPADRKPQLWFTYHLYHKAPDWLGPTVTQDLGIPYVVAEASHAPKQRQGKWANGYQAAAEAISTADLVFGINQADNECVLPLLADSNRLVPIKPFIFTGPFAAAANARDRHRDALASTHGLDPGVPWLLTVAMMRPGDKLASYRILGSALSDLKSRPWHLLVVGDGPARDQVRATLDHVGSRVRWLGQMENDTLAAIYAASDLYVWPAFREAWGMALLEAQAAGLPVVAGDTGGIPDVVADGESGQLVPIGDPAALASAISRLLNDPNALRAMGRCALERAHRLHDVSAAAGILREELGILIGSFGARQ